MLRIMYERRLKNLNANQDALDPRGQIMSLSEGEGLLGFCISEVIQAGNYHTQGCQCQAKSD